MENQEIRLPRTLDDPPEILLWSSDELVPLMLCIGIGLFIDHFFIMLFVGIVMWRVLRRYKDSRPNGHLMHALYWVGMPLGKHPLLANAYRRFWHG